MGTFSKRARKRLSDLFNYKAKEDGSPNKIVGKIKDGEIVKQRRLKKGEIEAPKRSELEFPILARTNDGLYVTCNVVVEYESDLQAILDSSERPGMKKGELETRFARKANSKIRYIVQSYARDELETEQAQEYIQAQLQSKLNKTFRKKGLLVDDLYTTPFVFHKKKPKQKLKTGALESAADIYQPLGNTKGIGRSDLEELTENTAKDYATLLEKTNPEYSSDRAYWTDVWTNVYELALEREMKKPDSNKNLTDYVSKREVKGIMKKVYSTRRKK